MSKFKNVSCSQCGGSFGPGDHGYSHCRDHLKRARKNLYDDVCLNTATVFLGDVPELDTPKNRDDLAAFLQSAIEDWLHER